jgi:glycosyltransferase involved in cell wall biosynthesis
MVSISYCVTVHNEGAVYLEPLFQKLLKYVSAEDEIIVVDDMSDDSTTLETLEKYKDSIQLHKKKFEGNFADHKNFAKSKCSKQYIFFIDADENIHDSLLLTLKEILYNNPEIELYEVPRINVVIGLTEEHKAKWGWTTNEKGWVMFPDYQTRIIKNIASISWQGRVHERLLGQTTHAQLPHETEDYCLLHIKNIERQEAQNKLYNNL